MTYAEKIHAIADHYGLEPQMRMLQEECAELTQTVNEYYRNYDLKAKASLAEKIADIRIVLEQMQYMFKFKNIVNGIVEHEINRQLERISNEDIDKG